MAFLQVESGELSGRRYEIGSEPLTVGRTDDNRIIMDDAAVSSHHCHVVQEGELCKIVDLDSTNGTLLNDAPVKESFLQDGDVVILGSVIITFRSGEAPTAEDPELSESPRSAKPLRESSAPMFKPLHRKNLVMLPVVLFLVACVVAAAAFFLHRLFSY